MLQRNFKVLVVFLSVLFLVSCGLFQVQTPIQAYAKALGVWTDTGTQFEVYYAIADIETQAKWDKEFRPKLLQAKDVLNIWKKQLDAGHGTDDQTEQWRLLKNELLLYLATNMQGG